MALLIVFLVVFIGFGVYSIAGKSLEASRQRKTAEADAASVVAKQADLTAKLAALDTPDGQEAALREQYPVVSPGEHVVIINDGSDDSAMVATGVSQAQNGGFWHFLTNLF